jgi:hypothetical protein
MKRTVLIPLLLSTFLLVGCESELDRCIEANTDIDQEKIMTTFRTWKGSIEMEMRRCMVAERKQRANQYKKEGLTNDEAYRLIDYNLENKDFFNYCKTEAIAVAKKTCNAQGIY